MRGGGFLFAAHGRMAAVAGVPAVVRVGFVSSDCGAVAYSGGIAESGNGRAPRFFLVLFRERTLPEISGEALSAGLQQAACESVLDAASGVAFPMEFIFAGSGGDCEKGVARLAHKLRGGRSGWRAVAV